MKRTFFVVLSFAAALFSASYARVYQQVLEPLKSGAPDGLGALSMPFISNRPVACIFASNAEYPDLLMFSHSKSPSLARLPFERFTDDGVPVFGQALEMGGVPQEILSNKGSILQTPDGTIHFITLEKGRTLSHWIYDPKTETSQKRSSVPIPKLPEPPRDIAAAVNEDGTVDVYFKCSPPTDNKDLKTVRTEDWYPYDGYGTDRRGAARHYFYSARYPRLLDGEPYDVRMVSPRKDDVYFSVGRMNAASLGGVDGLLTGTRMGEVLFYAKTPDGFSKKRVADPEGQSLRHPQVNASGVVFQGKKGDHTGLLLGGEGPVYYYAYTGDSTAGGAPVFKAPTPALQSDAALRSGSLPTAVMVDWDGDGVLDIISGGSEGRVRFFKNIGTNEKPKFLDAVFLEANGKLIQIEAGYSGSLQGSTEARWGYIAPTVIDWTGNGLPDLIIGDIRGEYNLYINKGTKTNPVLDGPYPLFCDGLNLKGRWRCGAAAAKVNGRNALAIVDDQDYVHLYWQIDNQNLEDGGRMQLQDGNFITVSAEPGGGSGRTKLFFYDWTGDGNMDMLIGTSRVNSVPNTQTGYPMPTLGMRTFTTMLLMRNVGEDGAFVFEHPVPFIHDELGVLQPGGTHETGISAGLLGSKDGKPSLLVAGENGQMFLIENGKLKAEAVAPVVEKPKAQSKTPSKR